MTTPMLARLTQPERLRRGDARATLEALLSSNSSDVDRAAILVALRARGDRPEELVEFAREMRARATPFPISHRNRAVDLCGSGGAARPSFNVSTVSALVARAAGLPVVKHGNRSRRVCGSSDLLAALGLPIATSIPFARESYRRYGIAFLHAPLFHPATRAVAEVRQRLGIPTIFNRLGPLSNPARVGVQVTGAVDVPTARATAWILARLGVHHGVAVTSDEGCDEFSPRRGSTAFFWSPAGVRRRRVHPERVLEADDRNGSWAELPPPAAAEETERLLAGGGGARRGAVLLTSGAALWAGGVSTSIAAGVDRARQALDSGAAEQLLAELRLLARRFPRSQEA